MPLVIVQTAPISAQQKRNIGDRIMEAFHNEGIPASSVVVLFQPDNSDIYLDGGLVHEAPISANFPSDHAKPFVRPESSSPSPDLQGESDFKTRARRTKAELDELKHKLVVLLQTQGSISSFKAQEDLGLKDCEWAPATLRRFFTELDEDGLISKHGQKRGTRYVWQGQVSHVPQMTPKLVKANEPLESENYVEEPLF